MEEKSLALSFSDSLSSDIADGVSDIAELALDSVLSEGFLQVFPVCSTVKVIYRIGNSIRERYNLKKLAIFVDEIRRGCVDQAKLQYYREKFTSNPKFRDRELEHIIILLDRHISLDRPRMLAKLYLAYLDGNIDWNEFSAYAEIIERCLPLDCNMLISEKDEFIVPRRGGGDSVLRLYALGLLKEEADYSTFKEEPDGRFTPTCRTLGSSVSPDKTYKRTEFGEKLACILR